MSKSTRNRANRCHGRWLPSGLRFAWAALAVAAMAPCGDANAGAFKGFDASEVYREGATWQEALRRSRDRLVQAVSRLSQDEEARLARDDPHYRPMAPAVVLATTCRGPAPIKVRVAGLSRLYVGSCPLVAGSRSDVWLVSPRLIRNDGSAVALPDVPDIAGETHPVTQYGGLRNRELCYPLDEQYEWFEAEAVGAHDGGVVWVDARPRLPEKLAMAAGRAAIWARLAADFSASGHSQEQSNESADGIWTADWAPGDFAELAGRYAEAMDGARREIALALAERADSPAMLQQVRELYALDRQCRVLLAELPYRLNPAAMRRAIEHLSDAYPARYAQGAAHLDRLADYAAQLDGLKAVLTSGTTAEELEPALALHENIVRFQQEALLLSNPVLDFEELLVIRQRLPRRTGNEDRSWYLMGWFYNLPPNWSSDFRGPGIDRRWDHEISVLPVQAPDTAPATLFKPEPGRYLHHLDLHFDAGRMLFTMAGTHGRWQVFEMNADGTGLRQITPGEEPDVDNGDACYLPDGRIIFSSTRGFHGVPCEGGADGIANLCIMDPDGGNQRMLTFDQETNFHPVVLNDGRVMYLRYEYADTSHQFGGLLFRMNPDGTGQMEHYGSNSYWPNRIFYPRPVPGHPTMLAGIVTGHHAVARMGKLVIFDPAQGRRETSGVVQAIPGFGREVAPEVRDGLYTDHWPKCQGRLLRRRIGLPPPA